MMFPLIPEPQRFACGDGSVPLDKGLVLRCAPDAPPEDRFAAAYLAECLKRETGIQIASDDTGGAVPVILRRSTELPEQDYHLDVSPDAIILEGADAAGLYYATQTLRQCLRHLVDSAREDARPPAFAENVQEDDAHGGRASSRAGLLQHGTETPSLPCLRIVDWPDLKYRAVHYDTKHHQDTYAYVQAFIRELAHYKVNVLVWEWEDKFAYERHPEIGAPGAFTKEQIQELTRFARQHHVQIVPLVQGLGHVSFILKHPPHRHLREIPDSNWEFCPLKDGTYDLLFDLWDEAIDATPGSEFIHIGSDETYELGLGEACGCRTKAEELGKDGLMQIFIRRCVEHCEKRGRKVLSWGGRWKPDSEHVPPKRMIFVDSGDPAYLEAAHAAGYEYWVYAQNPGITPLFLPFFPWVQRSMWRDTSRERDGSFIETGQGIADAARRKAVNGSITTSWDDSGLHNLCWMPRFICAAEFSWKADGRHLETWTRRYFENYFGPAARDMRALFQILQESAQFYDDTFQRRVWHWGDIGKIHPPDFPRGDLEYNDFWRGRYAHLLQAAALERRQLTRALAILDDNLARDVRHRADLEVFRTCARLMRHNAELILMLGDLEAAISRASDGLHYTDRKAALSELRKAEHLIEAHLADRDKVFTELVSVWERTRLPKGLSLPEKPYRHARDRARHFANRTPDMSYLILDEQRLELEEYLERLKVYNAKYAADNAAAWSPQRPGDDET
ncbi:MAG: beta-N-acetylhexosaminidase [Kiritimatiellae bacterium]|nr:beta-N-acetylhexosaminidase [Kiritimatiellia bacterium]